MSSLAKKLVGFEAVFKDKNHIDFYKAKEFIVKKLNINIDDVYIERYLEDKGYKHILKNSCNNPSVTFSDFEDDDYDDDIDIDFDYDEVSEPSHEHMYDLEKDIDDILDMDFSMNYSKNKKISVPDDMSLNKYSRLNKRSYSHSDNTLLIKEYNKSKNPDILELLVSINQKLIQKYVQYYSKFLAGQGLSNEDLFQEGCMGLIKAIENFNTSLGYEFSTYASNWIKSKMSRAIYNQENTIRIPVHVMEAIFRIRKCESKQLYKHREIIPQLVCDELNISIEKYRELKAFEHYFVTIPSLDMAVGEDESTTLIEFIAADSEEDTVFEAAAGNELTAIVSNVLETLTSREEKVLRLRFGLDDGKQRTLEEVGREFHVTRERIRQIEAKALRKLRHPSRSKQLRDFA